MVYCCVPENVNMLKELRDRVGISQRQLQKMTGISLSMIKKLESGERKINKLSLEKAFLLAMTLRVPLEMLIDEELIELKRSQEDFYHELTACIVEALQKTDTFFDETR